MTIRPASGTTIWCAEVGHLKQAADAAGAAHAEARRAPEPLWTAARHKIPVAFVVARNGEYAALKGFTA